MEKMLLVILIVLTLNIPSTNDHSLSINQDNEMDILLVAVYPTDEPPQKTLSEIEDLASSVAEYLDAESYGKLNVKFTIEGWKRLSGPIETYVSNYSEPINYQIVPDTLDSLSTNTETSQYDGLVIIHSGMSLQRSHYDWGIYDCGSDYQFSSGLRVTRRVAIVSEQSVVTTFVRYLLHSFGTPYLFWGYGGGDNVGIYSFGVMGGGHAGLCGYTKMLLGFLDSEEDIYDFETGTKRITLRPLSSHGSGHRIVRYSLSDDEYYLIEARLDYGSDSELSINGVLITYVNRTASSGEPRIEVLRRDDCNSFTHAPLMEGESYCDERTGFTVKFEDETYQGANIIVSDSPILEWQYIERLTMPECDNIRDIQLVWDIDEFTQETHLYMSVVTSFESYTYLRIFDSIDYGRTWSEIVNTIGEVNVYMNFGNLAIYEGNIIYVSRLEYEEEWYSGIVWKTSYREDIFTTDLSIHTNAYLYPWMEVVSNNSTLYLAAYSTLNGSSITYVKLDETGWSNKTFGLNLDPTFVMLNVVGNTSPAILFRNSTGLYSTSFNSSEAILLSSEIIWNIRGLQLDVPYAAFSITDGENEWFRVSKIVNNSFQQILEEELVNPTCQAFSAFNNTITIIVRDLNGTKLHRIDGDSNINYNISEYYSYSMSKITPNDSIWNSIIAYKDSEIFTVHRENTTPEDYEQVVWGSQINTSSISDSFIQIFIVSSLVLGVGSVCTLMGRSRNISARGKNW